MAFSACTEADRREMSARYHALAALCADNLAALRRRPPVGAALRLQDALQTQMDVANEAAPVVDVVQEAATKFDYDPATPGNGYRSFIYVMGHAVDRAAKHAARLRDDRDTRTFRPAAHAARAEDTAAQLRSLLECLGQLRALLEMTPDDTLYVSDEHSKEFLEFADKVHAEPFYGALIGFQFAPSMRTILRRIGIAMATYNVVFESDRGAIRKAAQALWAWQEFLFSPEKRAQRLAHVSKTATLEFCKSFWFLAESDALHRVQSFQGPRLAVNKMVPIPATQPLTLGDVTVPAPCAHAPLRDLRGLLLSALPAKQRCARLVLHFHGGGFVAQSPRSHERYLRDWATTLQAPLFSIDYSLAPEAPYPRPLQEALYAYVWARQNCELLGWTGETIVFAGDSAGGNLSLALGIKCVQLGLPLPEGLFLAYFPALVSVSPSPARLLTFIDPILPYGILLGCLAAYACPPGTDPRQPVNIPKDADLSPWLASDDHLRKLPPVSVLGLHLDPCLDDCVMLTRRLRRLGNRVSLDLVGGLPHGFLYFAPLSPEARAASDLCVQRIVELLNGVPHDPVDASHSPLNAADASIKLNGGAKKGVVSNGVVSNGVSANGVGSNGIGSNGVAKNGIVTNGVSSEAVPDVENTKIDATAQPNGVATRPSQTGVLAE